MADVVISSGHGLKVRGASGVLDEVDEARKVVEQVADMLSHADIDAIVFHDDTSTSQDENLQTIVDAHNRQNRLLDVSVHFNAYDGTAHGVEVLYVTQDQLAASMSTVIAGAGRFTNRGAKFRSDLYVLNNTNEPAILIEVCFVDSEDDAQLYREHFGEICRAISDEIKRYLD